MGFNAFNYYPLKYYPLKYSCCSKISLQISINGIKYADTKMYLIEDRTLKKY